MLSEKALSWIGLGVAVAGILTHPALLDLLPDDVALLLSGFGAAIQAFAKPLLQRTSKDESEEETRS